MKLFSKLKDHNTLLEEILENKTFSSIAKSLLLSMVYKLEISYKDYMDVNIDSVSKDRFLNNILDIIKKYCDNIKIVEPESSQATLLEKNNVNAVTNTKERSILAYPTEIAMLSAICDIEPKYFFVKNDFVFRNTLQKLLVTAYKQTTIEILKNFNGWSWEVGYNENYDYVFNLIYFNIMMIRSDDFLYDWRTDNKGKKNYLFELKNYTKRITGNDDFYISLCTLLSIISKRLDDKNEKKELTNRNAKYKEFLSQDDEFRKKNIKEFNKLKKYHDIYNNKNSEYEELIELQKHFLKFMEKKIEYSDLSEQMIEVLYELRLYKNLIISRGILIKNSKELKESLDNIMKLAITKACKMGILKIVSMNIETNFEILEYVLDTKIIDIEQTKIYLEIENDEIFIKVYDKEVFEKQGKIKFSGDKKDIKIRKNKKVRIFI